jgi:hypothetical protein
MTQDHEPSDDISLLRSRFIAGLIGPVMLAIAAAMIVNTGLMAEIAAEAARDKALIFMSGLLLLTAGLAIVQLHQIWQGWPVAVTLIGWLSVGSGLARILFPFELADMVPRMIAGPMPMIGIAICALAGAFLTAKAYL